MAHTQQAPTQTQAQSPQPHPEAQSHPEHEGTPRRDRLAQTGPLFAVLFPMLLVYGLAVLTGATASTGALIGALVLLVVVTYGVVAGTVHMIKMPPEDGDERHGQHHAHG